jgi:transposase
VAELRNYLGEPRLEAALARGVWTRQALVTLVQSHFGITLTSRSIVRVIRALGITVDIARGGAPRRLNAEQLSQLQQLLQAPPKDAGLEGTLWTQRRIAHLVLERFGVSIRRQNIQRLLKRRGVRPAHGARRGGQSHLNTVQIGALAQALSQPPVTSGVHAPRWSRAALANWMQQQFSVRYTVTSVSALLRRHGLTLRRPRERSTATPAPGMPSPALIPGDHAFSASCDTIRE